MLKADFAAKTCGTMTETGNHGTPLAVVMLFHVNNIFLPNSLAGFFYTKKDRPLKAVKLKPMSINKLLNQNPNLLGHYNIHHKS